MPSWPPYQGAPRPVPVPAKTAPQPDCLTTPPLCILAPEASKSKHLKTPRRQNTREDLMKTRTMKPWLVGALMLLSPTAFAQQPPEIPFDSVPNFLKLPPDMHLGEASGVAVNSKGHVFVYNRGGSSQGPAFANTASQLLEFDHDGTYLREIGKGLYAWSFA